MTKFRSKGSTPRVGVDLFLEVGEMQWKMNFTLTQSACRLQAPGVSAELL